MRAKEFVVNINVPVSITLDADGSLKVNQQGTDSDDVEQGEGGTFVPPLQQKIELMKAGLGKQSNVIDQLIASDDDGPFEE